MSGNCESPHEPGWTIWFFLFRHMKPDRGPYTMLLSPTKFQDKHIEFCFYCILLKSCFPLWWGTFLPCKVHHQFVPRKEKHKKINHQSNKNLKYLISLINDQKFRQNLRASLLPENIFIFGFISVTAALFSLSPIHHMLNFHFHYHMQIVSDSGIFRNGQNYCLTSSKILILFSEIHNWEQLDRWLSSKISKLRN